MRTKEAPFPLSAWRGGRGLGDEGEVLQPYHIHPDGEAGVDEVGRGCLAGPVFAAAVILHPDTPIAGLQDSKKLGKPEREALAPIIQAKALAWAIGQADVEEIGRLNILHASHLAMHRAIAALSATPKLLLIDGNRFAHHPTLPHVCIVKGDGKMQSIAAASILAKVARDAFMAQLAQIHPQYAWERNMGYPTKAHRLGISTYGATAYHRPGFKLL